MSGSHLIPPLLPHNVADFIELKKYVVSNHAAQGELLRLFTIAEEDTWKGIELGSSLKSIIKWNEPAYNELKIVLEEYQTYRSLKDAIEKNGESYGTLKRLYDPETKTWSILFAHGWLITWIDKKWGMDQTPFGNTIIYCGEKSKVYNFPKLHSWNLIAIDTNTGVALEQGIGDEKTVYQAMKKYARQMTFSNQNDYYIVSRAIDRSYLENVYTRIRETDKDSDYVMQIKYKSYFYKNPEDYNFNDIKILLALAIGSNPKPLPREVKLLETIKRWDVSPIDIFNIFRLPNSDGKEYDTSWMISMLNILIANENHSENKAFIPAMVPSFASIRKILRKGEGNLGEAIEEMDYNQRRDSKNWEYLSNSLRIPRSSAATGMNEGKGGVESS